MNDPQGPAPAGHELSELALRMDKGYLNTPGHSLALVPGKIYRGFQCWGSN
jgi:hypothetical protein